MPESEEALKSKPQEWEYVKVQENYSAQQSWKQLDHQEKVLMDCNLGYRVSMTPYRQCMIKQLREKGQIPLRRLMAHPLGSESNSPLLMCGLASLNDFIPECSVKRATVENSDKHQFRQMIFDKSCGVVKMTSDLCSLTYHTHQPSFILRKPSDNPIKSHPRTGEVAQ